ncbi:hypothetical protein [Thermobispora bispora]|jgi:hypothetical protein|uniref:Lipoprotein n=2 Tax=Thermobispora bispora TaxID=2006 RepID=D6YBG3_THEBD|nr:hypothetical protein [Thermobispora bispora]ADG88523.1 hypothetical protein Tbis_1811 [Thermobispora bispora DSM 43833]
MLRSVVVIALMVMTAGCMRGHMEPTITKDEALARVEELINDTVANIDPKPRLDVDPTTLKLYPCIRPPGQGLDDRIYIARAYYLRGIPKDKIAEVAQQVRVYWEQQGHVIEGVSKNGLNIAARSRPDDFILSLSWTAGDVLMIGATSHCIWPNGTPEPSRSPDPGEP